MNAEEKVGGEPDTTNSNRRRTRSRRHRKRTRTNSGISNDEHDANQNNDEVEEDKVVEKRHSNVGGAKNNGRGRKRKTTNVEKSGCSTEENSSPSKQSKDGERESNGQVRQIYWAYLNDIKFCSCAAAHIIFSTFARPQ